MEKLKVFESFAGYGSQAMALKRIGVPFEVVGISEIDKYAIQAYNAVHGETKNFGDICKIDWGGQVPDFDLFTYSFPCTDISSAGLQKGLSKGSGTRSGLLWECEKAIRIKRPKYLLMENVKALVSSKFMGEFKAWQDMLTALGYTNYTQVLNSKDYGIPQNRERVFMVSILGNEWFNFHKPIRLEKCLGDVLESDVDRKYYLSQKLQKLLFDKSSGVNGTFLKAEKRDLSGVARCLTARMHKMGRHDNYIHQVGNLVSTGNFDNPQRGRVYNPNGISPCLNTVGGGNLEPKILLNKSNIRKLTPRECFRLMDVSEDDINKIQATGISNTQQYKMAGNSIIVAVQEKIFEQMFCSTQQQTLFG